MDIIKEKQPITTEKSADSKFVRSLFFTLAWIFATGLVVYAIWVNKWLFFGLIIAGQIGVAINIALKDL